MQDMLRRQQEVAVRYVKTLQLKAEALERYHKCKAENNILDDLVNTLTGGSCATEIREFNEQNENGNMQKQQLEMIRSTMEITANLYQSAQMNVCQRIEPNKIEKQ